MQIVKLSSDNVKKDKIDTITENEVESLEVENPSSSSSDNVKKDKIDIITESEVESLEVENPSISSSDVALISQNESDQSNSSIVSSGLALSMVKKI